MTPGRPCDVSIDCTLTPGVSDPAGGRAVCKNYIVSAGLRLEGYRSHRPCWVVEMGDKVGAS